MYSICFHAEKTALLEFSLFFFAGPAFLQEIPLAGPKDAAFRHYSGPAGKPTYEMKLRHRRRGLRVLEHGCINMKMARTKNETL